MPKLVFLGDSVTDCARKRAMRYQGTKAGLGTGWVQHLNQELSREYNSLVCWNRGFSGCLSAQLMQQSGWWPDQTEGVPETVDLTTLLIGINDIWHPFWRKTPHNLARSLASFRLLIETVQLHSERVLVCEPFALPSDQVTADWWPLLQALSDGQRSICAELDAYWCPMQAELLVAAEGHPSDYLADGIHPTDLGHRWLAGRWRSFTADHKLLD
jgi:acyl-CoA thioesterase-1